MKSSTKKEIRAWLIIAALQIAWIAPCTYAAMTREPVEYEVESESEEDIIRWKQEEYE